MAPQEKKEKKNNHNMAEECRRESGSPSCSIVFVSLCFVTKMWQWEEDRTLPMQMMSYKMYTKLFHIYVEIVLAWIARARGRREEGRGFAVSNRSVMNVKTCKCYCFQWDNGRSTSLEKVTKLFVFEASCPLSGLDLVCACHVFQSDPTV